MAGKPQIVAVLAARGAGKTAWAVQQPRYSKARRLMVWDLMREPAHAALQCTADLQEYIGWLKARTFRVAFQPSPDDDLRAQQFDLFMRAAMSAGRLAVHVEELAFVTTAHKAPPAWRRACLLGRHAPHELTITGTSQRPAQVDKEFLGNADILHAGRLMGADASNVARILGVRPDELEQLPDLAWIEREGPSLRRGVLTFGGASKAAKPPADEPPPRKKPSPRSAPKGAT